MMTSPFPQNYEQWKYCITVECGIKINANFVSKRLEVWRNEKSAETKRFRHLYGDAYWRMMIAWFEQAEHELGVHNAR